MRPPAASPPAQNTKQGQGDRIDGPGREGHLRLVIDQNERVVRRREQGLTRNRMGLRHGPSLPSASAWHQGRWQRGGRVSSFNLMAPKERWLRARAHPRLGGIDKGGAGCFTGPKFMRSLREEEPRMTKPSSPPSYGRPLPLDVSKLTNRQKIKDGLERLPGVATPPNGAVDEDTVSLIAPPDRAPARSEPCGTGINGRRWPALLIPFYGPARQRYRPVAEAIEENKRRNTSLDIGGRSVRLLTIQGLPVLDTSAQEFRPGRNSDRRCHALRQQLPKLWMVPAEIMPAAVAVPPDSGT